MTTRDCIHGSLARSCNLCDALFELANYKAMLNERCAQLEADRATIAHLRAVIEEARAQAKEANNFRNMSPACNQAGTTLAILAKEPA